MKVDLIDVATYNTTSAALQRLIADAGSSVIKEKNLNRWIVVLVIAIAAATTLYIASRPPVQVATPSDESNDRQDVEASPSQKSNLDPKSATTAQRTPKLVGRQVCKECHEENFDLHAMHGHASTFARTEELDIAKSFDGRKHDAGQAYGTFHYRADSNGSLFATLPEKFGEEPFPLHFAIGSGHNGFTFLTLLPDEDGGTAGIEHRVSLYPGEKLGLSPGHLEKTPRDGVELFGDSLEGIALEKCVYCHTTSATIINQDIHDLVPNVNCEKCHGPGSEHVRQARLSKTPPPYSVGREQWDAEYELQLCGDCHRLPKDVTEKQLREYPDLLARFQPIGLLRSECYLQSEGKLKCTTCHDPHRTIREVTIDDHVRNCIKCHQENKPEHVVCPVSATTNCVQCHMRGLKQDFGSTFHDHWIRVQDD